MEEQKKNDADEPDDESNADTVLVDMLDDLLDFVKSQKEKYAGTERGRQVSILYTDIEKLVAWFYYMDNLD